MERIISLDEVSLAELESNLYRVQQSTKTVIPAFIRPHNWLRLHNRWYYHWHVLPHVRVLHVIFLLAYLLISPVVVHHYVTQDNVLAEGPVTTMDREGREVTTQTKVDNPKDDLVTLTQEALDETFPNVGKGFNNLAVEMTSASRLLDSKKIKETVTLDKQEREGTSHYALDSGVTVTTEYKPSKAVSLGTGSQPVKQVITITNPTRQTLTTEVKVKQTIASDTITWDGKEYKITTTPQTFQAYQGTETVRTKDKPTPQGLLEGDQPLPEIQAPVTKGTTITFPTPEGTGIYDFSDLVSFHPTVSLVKNGNQAILILTLPSVTVQAKSQIILDPTYDMANSNNFHLRYDGANANNFLGFRVKFADDIDGDGKSDLILANYGTSNVGSVYIIYNSLLSTKTGTGNTIDLANASNYNLRIDGANTNDYLVQAFAQDMNNDGANDLVIGAVEADYNSRSNSGSLYIIYSSILRSFSGTGNTISVSNPNYFNIRIDGANADDRFGSGSLVVDDVDNDQKGDIVTASYGADNNGRTNSGSVYIIKNTIFGSLSGTGNTLDMASSNNYSIRYDGAANTDFLGVGNTTGVILQHLDPNDRFDLIITNAYANNNSRNDSGSAYIIYDSKLASYSGTGNNVDLATISNFNIRLDGANAGDYLSYSSGGPSIQVGDIDTDTKPDLFITAGYTDYNSRIDSGSLYGVYGSRLASLTGSGNTLDLANSSNFNIRIDGAAADDFLADNGVLLDDINHDTKLDILVNSYGTDYNGSFSGSTYVIFNSVVANFTGTGNLLDLANSNNYSLRFDGATVGENFSNISIKGVDVNHDDHHDFMIGSTSANNNGRNDSGSVYVIYNFPHNLSVTSLPATTPTQFQTVTGSVTANQAITNITNVQASVDTPGFSGNWFGCTPTDGLFNSRDEAFRCEVTLPSAGNHTIRVRAADSNGVYTAVSRYAAVSTNLDTTPPSVALTSIGNGTFRPTTKVFRYISSNPRPVFAGTAEAGAVITVATSTGTLCTTTATSSGTWTCKTTKVMSYGDHTVAVSAKDGAGNMTTLKSFTLKVEPPTETQPEGAMAEPELSIESTVEPTTATPFPTVQPVVITPTPQGSFWSSLPEASPMTTLVAGIAALATAAAPLALVASQVASQAVSWGSNLFPNLGLSVSSAITGKRRKNGQVISTFDEHPLPGVTVTLYDTQAYNRVVSQITTDQKGEYAFFVPAGTYVIGVTHPSYTLTTSGEGYHGEVITLQAESVISPTIRLTPTTVTTPFVSSSEFIRLFIHYLHYPILILGTLLAITTLFQSGLLGVWFLLGYGVIWLLDILSKQPTVTVLTVRDSQNQAIPSAIVRLRDTAGAVILAKATTTQGKVLLLVPEGEYTLEITPPASSGLNVSSASFTMKRSFLPRNHTIHLNPRNS